MSLPTSQRIKVPQPNHLSLDHYWSALSTYWQHSNRNELIEKWIEDNFELKIVKILSERLGDQIKDQPLQVLGVGSGEGYQERIQMKILKSNFSQISATVLEPSTEQITKYQDAVAKSCDLGGVNYEWHNQTFQQYMESTGSAKQKYHFITIVEAMYFMGDAEEAVRNLQELLIPGGVIFMILATEHTGHGKLQKSFPHLALEEQNPRNGEQHPRARARTNYATNSLDVKAVLKKNQIAYTQWSYTASADLTPCFTQEDTPVAKNLLDIATNTKDFKESVSDEVFNQVMDFLKHNTRIVKSDQGEDKYYFDTACDVLLISK
ncbi:histamine N-methyltransferase-like [Amphiura filiformis]|uniref:histamine N-methyltransferase-like n=1 Tax=Amphiura filiformis TaxID=82378 RepID=UPI003B22766C